MKIHHLAAIALVGFALRSAAAVPAAADWQASKSRAVAYMDAYEKRMAGDEKELDHLKEVRQLAAKIENSHRSLYAEARAMLVLHEPDAQRRAERLAVTDEMLKLRMIHLYGNLIPRILNDFDTAYARRRSISIPFPVRPVEITHEEFTKKDDALLERLGMVDEPSK